MKTIEEVKTFLASFDFSLYDAERIMGFLLGKGLVEKGEMVEFCTRKGKKQIVTFDDFYSWFEEDECVLCGLLNFLQDEQDKAMEAGDTEKADRLAMYLGFLVEELNLEYEEVDEEENA